MEAATRYNKKKAVQVPSVSSHPTDSLRFAEDVRDWQESHGLTADGKLGPTTLAYVRQEVFDTSPSTTLGDEDYMKIVRYVSRFEGKFWSCNRDGEFKGLFDRKKKHWASGKTHIGLSFGFIQFTQDGGALGELLKLMYERDGAKFKVIFGPHFQTLIDVTNRKKKTRVKGRSPRVQPIGGHDLWEDYWVKRFISAGHVPAFQECQMSLAVKNYMKPAIKSCKTLGLSSQRALAIVFDRSVQYGASGAKKLIIRAGGPEEEHLRLNHLLKTWKDKRWHHRVQKLYLNPTLMDSTCVFG